jgi:hypothetical protein
LAQLLKLSHVSLGNNQLTGPIPPALARAPLALGTLFLQNNLLSSSVPVGFGSLTALSHLWLSNNRFTHQLPEDILTGPALHELRVHDNALTGTIPRDCTATNLRVLNVARNRLRGRVPKQASNLTSLVSVDLSQNVFTGPLPLELGGITSMVNFQLSGNRLHEPLPLWTNLRHSIDPRLVDFVPDGSYCSTQKCSSGPDRCDVLNVCCAANDVNCIVAFTNTTTLEPTNEPNGGGGEGEGEGASASSVILVLVAVVGGSVFLCAVRAFVRDRQRRDVATSLKLLRMPARPSSQASPLSLSGSGSAAMSSSPVGPGPDEEDEDGVDYDGTEHGGGGGDVRPKGLSVFSLDLAMSSPSSLAVPSSPSTPRKRIAGGTAKVKRADGFSSASRLARRTASL